MRILHVVACALAAVAALASPARAADYEVRRDLVYSSPGGEDLLLDAYIPSGPGPFPAVLVVHGGGWRSGSRRQLSLHAGAFARAGMAAFAIDYRLAPRHKWPAQIDDCRAALRWIRDRAAAHRVDPDAIGAYGYSAGGHLVAHLATAGGDGGARAVRAVVAGGAPCDFRAQPLDSRFFAYFLGATPRERPDVYRDASPAAHVSRDDAPILFFHGSMDILVPSSGAEAMSAALRGVGVESDVYLVRGAGHIVATISPGALERATAFLRAHLARDRPRGPF